MADLTVLGMPVDLPEDDKLHTDQPLYALVVVKVLGADGIVGYRTLSTQDLMAVEALGMARYAAAKLEHGMFSDD